MHALTLRSGRSYLPVGDAASWLGITDRRGCIDLIGVQLGPAILPPRRSGKRASAKIYGDTPFRCNAFVCTVIFDRVYARYRRRVGYKIVKVTPA
jgi:hypothetical protein